MCVIPFVISYDVKERDILLYRQSRKRGRNKVSSYLAYNYMTNPSTLMVKMCYKFTQLIQQLMHLYKSYTLKH